MELVYPHPSLIDAWALGRGKLEIDSTVPLRAVLQYLALSPSRFPGPRTRFFARIWNRIVEIAPDAEANKEAGSFYKVMIAPERTSVIAKNKTIPLRPGLTLTAEVVTERKSILNLILEPFRKLKGGQEARSK